MLDLAILIIGRMRVFILNGSNRSAGKASRSESVTACCGHKRTGFSLRLKLKRDRIVVGDYNSDFYLAIMARIMSPAFSA
jgi:hypothetical protein